MKNDEKKMISEVWGVKFIMDPSLTEDKRPKICPEKMARDKDNISRITYWPPELEKFRPYFNDSDSNE